MRVNSTVSANDLVLDEQAVSAFVDEIADSVENTALALISDRNGSDRDRRVIWQQSYQSGALNSEDCLLDLNGVLSEPMKRPLGRGNFAFDFPLVCANVQRCVFTLVVYTLDPPSLGSVMFQIQRLLACIARQIDLDATLTTATIETTRTFPILSLDKKLEAFSTGETTVSSLQGLVDCCFAECAVDCVAATMPATQSTAIACGAEFDRQSVNEIAGRLHKPLAKNRKLTTARITLADGNLCHVVCAPILRKQQSVDGMVFLIANEINHTHSEVIRLLANKIAKMRISDPESSELLNRFELVSQMTNTIRAQPTLSHSLIYFDSDKTHTINDAFGYTGGDRALSAFRRILVDSAGANDCVAHLGSDRFAMFLAGTSGDTAVAKAAQVLQFLAQESIDDDMKSITLSASAGVVDTAAASKGTEDMLVLAEVAARGAKDRGGNQSALFQDIDSSIIQRRSDVDKVGFLQMALIENRFVLHAQRIEAIGAETGQKYELLIRLVGEGDSGSSPAQFLSAAERYQLMAALDRWVINSALTSIAETENTLEASLATFCINVSAQSIQDDSFIDFVETRISESGVPPDTLCFELTETSLVRYIQRAQRFIHRLQRLGCLVALDDFGTGYSSFAYLKSLPVNFLKIDGAFVRDVLESDLSKTIVSAVVQIADVIGAQTVAEHVENAMVRAWLKQVGVHYAQGFAVHRPEPLANVLENMGDYSELFADHGGNIDLRSTAAAGDFQTQDVRKLQ